MSFMLGESYGVAASFFLVLLLFVFARTAFTPNRVLQAQTGGHPLHPS
jgi:hypothetical protein